MSTRLSFAIRAAALTALLTLPACGSQAAEDAELANLDQQIVGNNVDPALTSALEDQILVDPSLANQSNRNAVRPASTPIQAQYPLPAGDQAGAQGSRAGVSERRTNVVRSGAAGSAQDAVASTGTRCGGNAPFDYNPAWAGRLNPAFAIYPGGRLTEAAGNDQGDCRVRVVTFTTADAWRLVLDWYTERAVRAGYTAEHQTRGADHVLGGTKEADGGAFYLIVTPLPSGGSDVALIANNGR